MKENNNLNHYIISFTIIGKQKIIFEKVKTEVLKMKIPKIKIIILIMMNILLIMVRP